MDKARGCGSMRRGRVRRTRQQIRQQTLSVGSTYPVHEERRPRRTDIQHELKSNPGISHEEVFTEQEPSAGSTAERPCSSTIPAVTDGNFSVHAYPAVWAPSPIPQWELDGIEGGDSRGEKESESDEPDGQNFVVVEAADRDLETDNQVCSRTGVTESQIDSVVSPASIEGSDSELPPTINSDVTQTRDSKSRTERLLKWQNIYALLLTCGTVRMTVTQYDSVRQLHAWTSRKRNMPNIRTVQRSLMPSVRDFSYARSSICMLRTKGHEFSSVQGPLSVDTTSATEIPRFSYGDFRNGKGDAKEGRVRIVLPSEWALLDCRTGPLYASMFGKGSSIQTSQLQSLCYIDIDETPIVQNRERMLDTGQQIFVEPPSLHGVTGEQERLPIQAKAGDFISVGILEPESVATAIRGEHEIRIESDGVGYIVAEIMGVWGIEDGRPKQDGKEDEEKPSFTKCGALRNGDTVAEIVPGLNSPRESQLYIYLLVFRFCRMPRERTRTLLIAERSKLENRIVREDVCIAANICSVRMDTEAAADEVASFAPRTGFLYDGRKYVVYRALLYTDDFQPFVSSTKSYGGCYMLPLGISPEDRAGFAAVRCLGLTPPNISSNEILLHVTPDIVRCTTTGVDGKNALGESVTIFLDIVAYIGDYPAVSHALDVLGHTARAPCHLCSFVRQDRTGDEGFKYYGYTTAVHGRASSFCRGSERIQSVRRGEFPSTMLQSLGLKQLVDERSCPLHALSIALRNARSQVPITDRGVPVVPSIFDPYRSSMVAPDHLLVGLARDVINATLCMCSPRIRANAESLMRETLREHGLKAQNELFNMSKAQSTGDVASGKEPRRKVPRTQTSAHEQLKQLIMLLQMFQQLVCETQFQPRADVDGPRALQEYNERNGKARLDRLFNLACRYISELHRACTQFPKGVREHLSKPNVHRLLELYAHSLPAFGNIAHFQELLFETAHQPLKRGIKRSNNRDPHLAAVTAVLANDWETRLALAVKSAGDPEDWSEDTCGQIKQLVTGEECMASQDYSRVKSAFCPPVLFELTKVRRGLLSLPSSGVLWRSEQDSQGCPPSFAQTWKSPSTLNRERVRQALCCFNDLVSQACIHKEHVQIAKWASSWNVHHIDGDTSLERAVTERRKETVQPGNVVQSLVTASPLCCRPECPIKFLRSELGEMSSCSLSVSYWLVLELFETHAGCVAPRACYGMDMEPNFTGRWANSYAVVLPCMKVFRHGEDRLFKADIESAAYILPLSKSTRVVLCIHACTTDTCESSEPAGHVKHLCELSRGCVFYGLGRRDGYPPRAA